MADLLAKQMMEAVLLQASNWYLKKSTRIELSKFV